jgi:hypothetical protein
MLAAQLRLKPDTPKHKPRALLPYKPARYPHKNKNKIAVRNTAKTHKNNLVTYSIFLITVASFTAYLHSAPTSN